MHIKHEYINYDKICSAQIALKLRIFIVYYLQSSVYLKLFVNCGDRLTLFLLA